MKLARFARSINVNLSHQSYSSHITRSLSTNPFSGNVNEGNRNNESVDDFERRMFGGGYGNGPSSKSFFRKLDRLEKARNRSGGWRNLNRGDGWSNLDDLDDGEESFQTTLSDGVVGKLQKAAKYFVFRPEDEEKIANDEEIDSDDYAFRPDVHFEPGMTYELKDLDLTKPGVRKAPVKNEFKVTTEEVLKKADFRNVRFLANFITDAGIIVKRSMTGISAKAQRKVAREIKTARAFGLMPFTTMGTKSFVFGKTMEDVPKNDVGSRTYDNRANVDFL